MRRAQQSALREAIAAVLLRRPGIPMREIAIELATTSDISVAKSKINRILYANRKVFYSEATSPPVWYLLVGPEVAAGGTPGDTPPASPQSGRWAESLELYRWQVRALDGWASHHHRGVVEAVTGAGKTRLALAAIEAEIRRGGRAVAIVPTKDLQHVVGQIRCHPRGDALSLLDPAQFGDLRDRRSGKLAGLDPEFIREEFAPALDRKVFAESHRERSGDEAREACDQDGLVRGARPVNAHHQAQVKNQTVR